jgi:hypothetical protein
LSKQGVLTSRDVSDCKKKGRQTRKKKLHFEVKMSLEVVTIIVFALLFGFDIWTEAPLSTTLRHVSLFCFLWGIMFSVIHMCIKIVNSFGRPLLEPQSDVAKFDPYLKEAVQVWCLFESLRDARSKRGMIAAVTQYLQAHVPNSLPLYMYRKAMGMNTIFDWTSLEGQSSIRELLSAAFGEADIFSDSNEELILEVQDDDGSEKKVPWHVIVDKAFTDWKNFRHSPLAVKFTNLINVIVTCGMCSTADLTFRVGAVPVFTPMVLKRQLAATDVFDAFYEAISGFMKGGWRAFKTGEISAFFFEDDKLSDFDEAYNEIRSVHGYAISGNLREYTDFDDNDYDARLRKAVELGEDLLRSVPKHQTFERKYVSDRLDKVRDCMVEFTQLRTRGGLRIAPFAISLFGQSGCGKSSLTNLTINAGLLYNGLSADKDRIATWADNDKYASSIRSHINAIIFDDFANTKEKFMDFSPAYRLIQVINNIRYLAPMADVFLKGKVSLNPYFCVVSTNVEDLKAAQYSNEPESVLRRLYHVKVVPKSRFCTNGILSKDKIVAEFGHVPCPDVWDLTIRAYVAQNQRHVDLDAMVPVKFEGRTMENVSVFDYLRWVQVTSKKHFNEEDAYLANQSGLPDPCAVSGLYYQAQSVKRQKLETQNGYVDWAQAQAHAKAARIREYVSTISISTVLKFERMMATVSSIDIVPEWLMTHPRVLAFFLVLWRPDYFCTLIMGCAGITSIFVFFATIGCDYLYLLIGCWFLVCYLYVCCTTKIYLLLVKERILDSRNVVIEYLRGWQVRYALIGIGALMLILAVLRARKKEFESHDALSPVSMDEIAERNAAVNPWLMVESHPLPMSEPSKTTSSSDLARAMTTNLIGLVSSESKSTLGFYVTSNVLALPRHYVDSHGGDFQVRCFRSGSKKVGQYFRDKISKEYSVNVEGTDFTLCFLTGGGSMKDMRKFLPTSSMLSKSPAKFVTREILDSDMMVIPTLYKGSGIVSHSKMSFQGGYYDLPIETKKGMCMSPVVSDSRGSTILGFHLGGKGQKGGCGTLTQGMVNDALMRLSSVDGVVLSASAGVFETHMGDFPNETFGKPILTSTDIHYKSATRFLEDGACIDVYGETTGRATPHSNVTDTLISPVVEEVFGVPQQWGPPKMRGKGRYPYQATLVHSANPSLPIGGILSRAVGCYKRITEDICARLPELFHCSPLCDVSTVSGLKGVRFIDPMNTKTSPGFPLSGAKKKLLVDLDPDDYPHIGCPRTFIDEVWDEYHHMVDILKSGKRCYSIWKSCLKDEATALSKDKVRVFQSAPLVIQLLIRKYFLPVVRIIQMNPVLYECAVGVNAEGLEWEELWDKAMAQGSDRVLAGDYSKYDVRMPAQVTIAAFDVLLHIASLCKYTSEDLHVMRMAVNEVVYPIMAYNGDLLQLFGTNLLGQNLTVIINSVVNSLLLRGCFYSKYPTLEFKEECSFITYGDDVVGTVSEKCPLFTHITYAEWLDQFDMKFTMPDKEAIPVPYMKESEVDFLKRKSAFNPDLGRKVGLFSENSIFKRLHSHILSGELTKEMHSAQNIESSLHDWFYYGREVFERRRKQLKEAATRSGISHLCAALDVGYDERVAKWRWKYLGEGEEPLAPEATLIS